MKFQVGQFVELELKDGRKVKGEVGSLDKHGMTVWNAEVVNPDGTVSNTRIFPLAYQDILEKPEEAKVVEEVKPEAEIKLEKPSRRKKAARKR